MNYSWGLSFLYQTGENMRVTSVHENMEAIDRTVCSIKDDYGRHLFVGWVMPGASVGDETGGALWGGLSSPWRALGGRAPAF